MKNTLTPKISRLRETVGRCLWRLVRQLPDRRMLWESERRFNRRMADKYSLDFEHRCMFWSQVCDIAKGIRDDWSEQDVEVLMQSGQTALYRLTKHDDSYGGTGQKIWRFTFLRYLPNVKAEPRPHENLKPL